MMEREIGGCRIEKGLEIKTQLLQPFYYLINFSVYRVINCCSPNYTLTTKALYLQVHPQKNLRSSRSVFSALHGGK